MKKLPLLTALLISFLLFENCAALRKKNTSEKSGGETTGLAYRKKIATYAQKFVGTKYKYAGKTPSTGFDCSGFTSYVFKNFNIEISPASKEQARTGREIPLPKVKPGDLVFFANKGTKLDHVALVVSQSNAGLVCVHCTTSRGVVVDNISTSSYWKDKILFARDVISR